MDATLNTGDAHDAIQPIDVLAAFQTISGKPVECISVLCVVPFAEGVIDDIISCDSNVSVSARVHALPNHQQFLI
jgi:hypothetical protein